MAMFRVLRMIDGLFFAIKNFDFLRPILSFWEQTRQSSYGGVGEVFRMPEAKVFAAKRLKVSYYFKQEVEVLNGSL